MIKHGNNCDMCELRRENEEFVTLRKNNDLLIKVGCSDMYRNAVEIEKTYQRGTVRVDNIGLKSRKKRNSIP